MPTFGERFKELRLFQFLIGRLKTRWQRLRNRHLLPISIPDR
ncbi:uncharacterized protein Thert_01206 [Thermoanaerobacterium thermosaccharolyticum]|uniref:Uncharacterized protein n=1 Tax=Thermoanaerobacterium thermosaccharolyticum TaxID=1517 RepID=A0A223HYD9_THETR|nr:uncharacterized protein Thert_01206 [Thermoanaerobacterium thermosaccharolyticum]